MKYIWAILLVGCIQTASVPSAEPAEFQTRRVATGTAVAHDEESGVAGAAGWMTAGDGDGDGDGDSWEEDAAVPMDDPDILPGPGDGDGDGDGDSEPLTDCPAPRVCVTLPQVGTGCAELESGEAPSCADFGCDAYPGTHCVDFGRGPKCFMACEW